MDLYYWTAEYKDGGSLSQYNDDGTENKYTDIDRTNLVRFVLSQVNKGTPILAINFDRPGQRLIWRRRHRKHFAAEGGNLIREETIHIVGWQETVNGRNHQAIAFLFPNGMVEIRPGFLEGPAFSIPLETYLPCEKD